MENPLISIIVPVYNAEAYLQNCINSILAQSYSRWELILVDDGSTDSCPEICKEFAAKDNRINLIFQGNAGAGAARNVAIDIAGGEYITFLDSDDFWHQDYLKILLQLGLIYSADIVQCGIYRGSQLSFPADIMRKTIKILDNHSVFLQEFAKIGVCAKLYRRFIIVNAKMPTSGFFEDDFTTWKWYYAAKNIVVTSEKLYYYTTNLQSTMANHSARPCFDFIEAYDERIAFFSNLREKDLEDYSRAHLSKVMILSSMNMNISHEQMQRVKEIFEMQWKKIKYSKSVNFKLKILFMIHFYAPSVTKFILRKLRR